MDLLNQNQTEEQHPLLPSGEWEGFYCYDYSPDQHKMKFDLAFGSNLVSGSGIDDVAIFTWLGEYDLDSYKIKMTKSYSTHKVYYIGRIDENGIWGTWNISMDGYNLPQEFKEFLDIAFKKEHNGGFHIWPKKQNSNTNYNNAQQEESEKLKKLFVEVFK